MHPGNFQPVADAARTHSPSGEAFIGVEGSIGRLENLIATLEDRLIPVLPRGFSGDNPAAKPETALTNSPLAGRLHDIRLKVDELGDRVARLSDCVDL